jgi:hypothetical protein
MSRKNTLLIIVAGLMLLSWLPVVDNYGDRYTSRALTQATVTYGVVRGINGLVSVLQSTEVSIGIASVSPGEFLDPLNDLIERFSWIAMMAMASLGFQKLLLLIASSLLFKVLLTIAGGLFIYSAIRTNDNNQNTMMRLFAIALFLRFAVGAVVFANNTVEYYFLESTRSQATESLSETSLSLSDINLQSQQKDRSLWDDITGSFLDDQEDAIKIQTEKATNSILDLTVVYVAQAIFFPFLFLWVFYKVMLWVWAFNWAKYLLPSDGAHNRQAKTEELT